MTTTDDDTTTEGPRSAAVFITHVADGACHAQLSEKLHELGAHLVREAYNRDAKVKGELTLKFTFTALPSGAVEVAYKITAKAPEQKTAIGTVWLTPQGNFVRENPRQQQLPLREVQARPVREVAAAAVSTTG